MAVGLLQSGQHLAHEPDKSGPGQELVEGQDQRFLGRFEAARPGVGRIAVLHQGDEKMEVRVVPVLQDLLQRPGR